MNTVARVVTRTRKTEKLLLPWDPFTGYQFPAKQTLNDNPGVTPRLSYTLVWSGRIIKHMDFGVDWRTHVQLRTTFPFMARH